MIEVVIFIAGMFAGGILVASGYLSSSYQRKNKEHDFSKYIQQYKDKYIRPFITQDSEGVIHYPYLENEFEGYEKLFPLLEQLVTDNFSGKQCNLILTSYSNEIYGRVRLHDVESVLSTTASVEEITVTGWVFTPEPPSPTRTQEDMANIVRKMIKVEKSVISKQTITAEEMPQLYLSFINNLKWKLVDIPLEK